MWSTFKSESQFVRATFPFAQRFPCSTTVFTTRGWVRIHIFPHTPCHAFLRINRAWKNLACMSDWHLQKNWSIGERVFLFLITILGVNWNKKSFKLTFKVLTDSPKTKPDVQKPKRICSKTGSFRGVGKMDNSGFQISTENTTWCVLSIESLIKKVLCHCHL